MRAEAVATGGYIAAANATDAPKATLQHVIATAIVKKWGICATVIIAAQVEGVKGQTGDGGGAGAACARPARCYCCARCGAFTSYADCSTDRSRPPAIALTLAERRVDAPQSGGAKPAPQCRLRCRWWPDGWWRPDGRRKGGWWLTRHWPHAMRAARRGEV